MKQIKAGQIVENQLSNGQKVTCRVVGFIDSVGMYRLTDARETRSDEWLIKNNKTWAAPIENIEPVKGPMIHKTGLITLGDS